MGARRQSGSKTKHDSPDSKMPLTISRRELLRDGSDAQFRKLVHSFFGFLSRHEAVRAGHAARIGLAGIEYTILISIGHLRAEEGAVTVNRVASHLYLSGPFVTSITKKLMNLGLVFKDTDARDRRKVQLSVTPKGWDLLASLAPAQRVVNDVQFDTLSSNDLDKLLSYMERLIDSSERAIKLQNYLKSADLNVAGQDASSTRRSEAPSGPTAKGRARPGRITPDTG